VIEPSGIEAPVDLAAVSAEPAAQASPARALRRFPPPALQVRPFRWYWLAQWPVLLGVWMQMVALGYLVYRQTHSSTAVGVAAAAQGLPAVLLSLAGGVAADRVPRRRILLVTQSVLGTSAATLAVLAATGHATFAAIVVVAAVFGSADAVDLPTRQALVADLVDRELIVSAVALGTVVMSATRIAGPSLAGVLIAWTGPAACFATLALAYTVPLAVLALVIPDLPPAPRRAGSTALGEIGRALSTAARDRLVRPVLICVAVISFLGVSYMPYLPVLAATRLHGGSTVLGILYSTGGIGGLVGGVALASLGRTASRRPLLLGGAVLYACGLFTVSHTGALAVALPALVLITLGFLAMNTSLTTWIQADTDPAMRGRLLGIYTMLLAGLQPLGTLTYGLLAHVVPLFDAIGIGGLIVGAVGVLTAGSPAMRGASGVAPAVAAVDDPG